MRKILGFVLVVALLLPVAAAQAELSKAERKQAKSIFAGTLYLRMDAPCATGRHAWGTYKRPLVEVSPEGATDTNAQNEINASWWHADSTYWGIRINDPVTFDELEVDDDAVEVELVGIGPADGNETVIKFFGIHTLADLEKAAEHAFSRKPLQEEHDDWSADVKQAIADRHLQNGMSKRQVFYITGAPESFEKKTEGGKEVEIWNLRQDRGMQLGFWTAKAGETTGLPATIRFEDGVLVEAAQSGSSSDFKLD